ncbi:MAG: hypothetical protein M3250_06270 [Thermoproteota archaeon]|jgi:hypothetical protein|nr:hypothetical protein [Thermoproteota archaeon]
MQKENSEATASLKTGFSFVEILDEKDKDYYSGLINQPYIVIKRILTPFI